MKSILQLLILHLLLIQGSITALAQSDMAGLNPRNDAIVLSFLSDGTLGSISYEHQFFKTNYFFFTARAGYGLNLDPGVCFPQPCDASRKLLSTLPLRSTLNLGWKQLFVEGGISHSIFGGQDVGFDMTFLVYGIRYYPSWFQGMALSIEKNYLLRKSMPLLRMLYFPYGASLYMRF